MTSTTAAPLSTEAPKRTVAIAAVGLGAAGLVILAGNYHVKPGENGGTGPAVFTAVLCVLVGAALFALVLPRVRNAPRAATVLGILSLLSLVVFWSGVTPVLAAATWAAADRDARTARRTTAMRWAAAGAAALTLGVALAGSHLF